MNTLKCVCVCTHIIKNDIHNVFSVPLLLIHVLP